MSLKYSVRHRLNTTGKWVTDIQPSTEDSDERDDLIVKMSSTDPDVAEQFEESWNRCFQINICKEVDEDSALDFIMQSDIART